jgi:hypothetical protein
MNKQGPARLSWPVGPYSKGAAHIEGEKELEIEKAKSQEPRAKSQEPRAKRKEKKR